MEISKLDELNNHILFSYSPGNDLWYTSLTNDEVEDGKNIVFDTYDEAKEVFDNLISTENNRKFEKTSELDASEEPKIISIWKRPVKK